MRLFIPVVGSKLRLLNPLSSVLKNDGQNKRFISAHYALKGLTALPKIHVPFELPAGTVLTVERVYIRQGHSPEYNSLTFRVDANKEYHIPAGRFFLPVDIVNSLDVDVVSEKPVERDSIRDRLRKAYQKMQPHDRAIKSHIIQLFKQLDETPTQFRGDIRVDALAEMNFSLEEFNHALPYYGFESIAHLALSFTGDDTEWASESLGRINEWMQTIHQAHSDGTHWSSLYQFEAKTFNNEPVLVLEEKTSDLISILFCLEYEYNNMLTRYSQQRKDLNTHTGSFYTLRSLIQKRRYFVDESLGNTFGTYSMKSNYNPKEPFRHPDEQRAALLEDSFVDNILMRTKHDDHGHVFVYELDTGERLSIAEFRRMWGKKRA